jgi:amidase
MLALPACGPKPATPAPQPQSEVDDSLTGASIMDLRRELDAGVVTSEELVQSYLKRITAIDKNGPTLQSVLALNPDAVDQARTLDAELRQKKLRGPLHGVPILLKDNIESADRLPTTAGSLALVDNFAGRDAPIVANLRAAGAVILGKTNLSEWANYRSDHSLSGWSGLGGLTKNAHVLDRTPCGSSSGSAVAVAASLAAASVGTETDGSITCPAAMNGIVGLKPTVGLLPQRGIVPIAHSQDAAGPMALSVADAALMLNAMVGEKPACDSTIPGCRKADYAAALASTALQGKRIGVLRFASGRHPRMEPIYDMALVHLRDAGATLVEVKLPEMNRIHEAEETVLRWEFKAGLNAYLAATPATVKTRDLTALIGFNRDNPREMVLFGQEVFLRSDSTTGLNDAGYKSALADSKRLAQEGITQLLATQNLALLVAPTNGPAWRMDVVNGDNFTGSFSTLPAVAGFPHLTVPMGQIDHLPLGISFIGPAWSEDLLLAAGFAFEERAKARIKPGFLTSIDHGAAVAPR